MIPNGWLVSSIYFRVVEGGGSEQESEDMADAGLMIRFVSRHKTNRVDMELMELPTH